MNESWSAYDFIKQCVANSHYAQEMGFDVLPVSDLEEFEDLLNQLSDALPDRDGKPHDIIAVSDDAQGVIELEPHPRTRRIKSVFLAAEAPIDNHGMRAAGMARLREMFRLIITALIPEKIRLENKGIAIDQRITFAEMPRYFAQSYACAHFTFAVDQPTDFRYIPNDWIAPDDINARPNIIQTTGYLCLLSYTATFKVQTIRWVRDNTGLGLLEAKNLVESTPCKVLYSEDQVYLEQCLQELADIDAVAEIRQ